MSDQTTPDRTVRIATRPGSADRYLTVRLDESFGALDILSVRIRQQDAFRSFSAGYGCIVGRVTGGGGVGLPNCRISVFIPVSESDATNPEVSAAYPYQTPSGEGPSGSRYNLLPRLRKWNPLSGWPRNRYGIGYTPRTPVGDFPSKEEIVTNPELAGLYGKYYRHTTVTNRSGDYMLMGVPVGSHTMHLDCDLTDIGPYSMSPALLVKKLGYPEDIFLDEGTRIDARRRLADQPHIQTRNVTVDVRPFWGDAENRQVGITRQDFDIPGEITPSFVLFGSNFSMAPNAWWGDRIVFRFYYGLKNLCFRILKRNIQIRNIIPFFRLTLFKFDLDQIDGGQFDDEAVAIKNLGRTGACGDPLVSDKLNDEETDKVDFATHRNGPLTSDLLCYPDTVSDDDILRGNTGEGDLRRATRNEYVDYTEPGQFAYLVPCNRRRMVTDEAGNLTDSDDPSKGVYTEWRGAMLAGMEGEMESPKGRVSAGRVRMRIPQEGNYSSGWIKNTHLFRAGGYYTTAQFIHKKGGTDFDKRAANDFFRTPGYLSTVAPTVLPSYERMTVSDSLLVPQEARGFTGQWLIGALYFIQFAYKTSRKRRRVSEFITSRNTLLGNVQPLGGGLTDTRFLLNVDPDTGNGRTGFVELNKADIIALATKRNKSVVLETPGSAAYPSVGVGKHFFKGLKGADSLKLLLSKNLI